MIVPDSSSWLEPEALVDRAHHLWRAARAEVGGDRFDLFLKIARRRRAQREPGSARTSTSETLECGLAMRRVRAGSTLASFAACSGVSNEALEWILGAVSRDRGGALSDMPEPGAVVEPLRSDVDDGDELPTAAELQSWMAERKDAAWIESGGTREVVVGDEGWVAVRGRNRSWAMTDSPEGGRGLFAARGLAPPDLADWADAEITPGRASLASSTTVVLAPNAAATVISGVVRAIYAGDIPPGPAVGEGWCLADEPGHPAGLSGGTFDDAGFESRRTILADGREAVGTLPRAGTLRRASFRDAPSPAASTVVVFADAPIKVRAGLPLVTKCRILPISQGEWVLDLGAVPSSGHPAIARVSPEALAKRCVGTIGRPVVCADGVITPGLVFAGLEIAQ